MLFLMGILDAIKNIWSNSRSGLDGDAYLGIAAEAANEGLWEWNPIRRVLRVSPSMVRLFDYSREELQEIIRSWRSFWPMIDPQFRRKVYQELSHVARGSQNSFSIEFRVRNFGGQWLWVNLKGKALAHSAQGIPVRMCGAICDISRQKEYEQDLVESKRKLDTLIQNIPGVVYRCLVDDDWTMTFLSENCQEVFGYPASDLIDNKNLSYDSLIIPQDRQLVYDGVMQAMAQNRAHRMVYRIRHSDGSVRWVLEQGLAVRDEQGIAIGLEGVINDITAQKEIELELKCQKENAEQANRAKTTFLASMSHELRTPLNGIFGFCQMLRQSDNLSLEQGAYINVIETSSNRLIDTIDNIFDVVVIETGNVATVNELIDLDKFFDRLFVVFSQKKAEYKKTSVLLEVNKNNWGEPVVVNTDVSLLERTFKHLLDNALKFTQKGKIEFGYKLVDKDSVCFFVCDTGIGVPSEKISEIFDMFKQVDDGLDRQYEGAGTGLYIAKNFVELLGGHLSCSSRENFGTEISFELEAVSAQSIEQRGIGETCSDPLILVVEDDPDSVEYYSTLLRRNNYKLVHAANGEEAIDLFKATPGINFVLMDLHLPKVDGFEALKAIKSLRPDVPVIAQTAFAIEENRRKCLEAGFDDYVSKPVSIECLTNLLGKFLGDRQAG